MDFFYIHLDLLTRRNQREDHSEHQPNNGPPLKTEENVYKDRKKKTLILLLMYYILGMLIFKDEENSLT